MRAVAVLACLLLAGCGGDILYAGRLTRERLEPAANLWRDVGAELNIVYGPAPAGGDTIYIRRSLGPLGASDTICGATYKETPWQTHSIELAEDCPPTSAAERDVIAHELGHYLRQQHIPTEGIMAAGGYGKNPDEHLLSCTDVRQWCTSDGCDARDYCETHHE